MLYKDEGEFKQDYMKALSKMRGYMVTPIQTRTVVGVPDLYIVGGLGAYWVECKIIHRNFPIPLKEFKVPYRPGQQAWAYKHYVSSQSKLPVVFAIAFNDAVVCYPFIHSTYRDDNCVHGNSVYFFNVKENTVLYDHVDSVGVTPRWLPMEQWLGLPSIRM